MTTITSINNFADLLSAVRHVGAKFGTEVWWRGHAKEDWHLTPGVMRSEDMASNEQYLAASFKLRAITRHPRCPEDADFPGWLFFMQHYRLPTRLLDWSESILIAVFFACSERPSEDGALWAISPYALNQSRIGMDALLTPDTPSARALFRAPFGSVSQNDSMALAVTAKEVDARMMAQLSQFTIHGSPSPLESEKDSDKFLHKYLIPYWVKEFLAKDLSLLGIRESNLFPDLEHLSRELIAWTGRQT